MRPTVPVFLACIALCVAIPFQNTAAAKLLATRVKTLKKESLDLPVSNRQSGLNFSPCKSNSSVCVGDRGCFTVTESQTLAPCSTNSTACVCLPEDLLSVICTEQSECDQGESCVTSRDNPGRFCVANEIVPFISDDPPNTSPSGNPPSTPPSTTDSTSPPTLSSAPTPVTTPPVTTPPVTTPPTSTESLSSSTNANAESATSPVSTEPGSGVGPDTQPQEGSDSPGLTLDPCQSTTNCEGDRTCLNLPLDIECNGEDCRCFPNKVRLCDSDADCVSEERCMTIADVNVNLPMFSDDFKQSKACISRAALGTLPCIGVHSLRHISREELVFEKDAVAHVLCDFNESCATPGHMVRYMGTGMMMKSYCELTGCVRKVMRVNSPKYRRGLTVESRTEHLVFTALAARFESRAEEGVLATAVRFGF